MVVYFLDNDIIIKLSAYNLFWETMKAWGIDDPEIRVLPTASRFISRDWSIQAQYDDRTRNQAIQIVNKCANLANPGNPEYFTLQGVEGIDVGEALLISATSIESDAYIATADKRCLRALANSGMTATLGRLQHRIICLEQLVIQLVQTSTDFDKISRRINRAVECEVSVTEAFKLMDQSAIIQRLQVEIDRLRGQTGNLLVL
ncbi:MAG: hypothetical protein F6K31_34355 [Symploca sp. SIO2G7]|nr:hypothetical protein [Symploca sp. SIO2G7]